REKDMLVVPAIPAALFYGDAGRAGARDAADVFGAATGGPGFSMAVPGSSDRAVLHTSRPTLEPERHCAHALVDWNPKNRRSRERRRERATPYPPLPRDDLASPQLHLR